MMRVIEAKPISCLPVCTWPADRIVIKNNAGQSRLQATSWTRTEESMLQKSVFDGTLGVTGSQLPFPQCDILYNWQTWDWSLLSSAIFHTDVNDLTHLGQRKHAVIAENRRR
jgi:hypothetical protein